ncbi:flotillin-like FloA family protein [Gaoshiqia sediminis]|uniref:Flotillin-like FloA family protein n=1 Tax=Gaoshiqia sediminis TaxID=2986998 RepID=A0AA41YDC3_9BACT|nr:flotillin-like FloA family protein [Gaoshiqia sediminis]MCW0484570.1 flotillin-like FloA family protein [Gaoshiqia sediminis]
METVLITIFLITGVLIVLYYVPIGLWLTAMVSGVRVSLMEIFLMRFRKTPPALIIQAMIMSHKGGVPLSRDQLEAHHLAGGNVTNVVHGLIAAKKAGLKLSFDKATAADIQGVDLLEAVKTEAVKRGKQEPMFE